MQQPMSEERDSDHVFERYVSRICYSLHLDNLAFVVQVDQGAQLHACFREGRVGHRERRRVCGETWAWLSTSIWSFCW